MPRYDTNDTPPRSTGTSHGRDTFGDRKIGDDKCAREVRDPDQVPEQPWDQFMSGQTPEPDATPTPDRATRVRGTSRIG